MKYWSINEMEIPGKHHSKWEGVVSDSPEERRGARGPAGDCVVDGDTRGVPAGLAEVVVEELVLGTVLTFGTGGRFSSYDAEACQRGECREKA